MATTATPATKSIKKSSVASIIAKSAAVLLILVLTVRGIISFFTPNQASAKSPERITEFVEVASYKPDTLPQVTDPQYFDIPLSKNLQKFIYEVCAERKVPVTLVLAMIEQESDFNQDEVSNTGDYGLMQINEINHSEMEEKYRSADMLNPYQNVYCGIRIIGSYINKYNENYPKALMAYNMGQYGMSKAWEDGIHETEYTKKVIEKWTQYESLMEDGRNE